jgi:hypothetical protein
MPGHTDHVDKEVNGHRPPPGPRKLYDLDASGVTDFETGKLEEELRGLSERCLAMQLYYTYQGILGCQEAMWEELNDRMRNRKQELIEFGWEDDEDLQEFQGRKKFERLVERYRT